MYSKPSDVYKMNKFAERYTEAREWAARMARKDLRHGPPDEWRGAYYRFECDPYDVDLSVLCVSGSGGYGDAEVFGMPLDEGTVEEWTSERFNTELKRLCESVGEGWRSAGAERVVERAVFGMHEHDIVTDRNTGEQWEVE